MAAKRTSELIPLCHPISITHVGVELEVRGGAEEDVMGEAERGEKGKGMCGEGEGGRGEGVEKVVAKWQGTGQGDAYPFHTPPLSPKPIAASSTNSNEEVGTGFGSVEITATVSCDGKTGVEMEALTAASTAALTVYDMCKAVDKGMRIDGLRVTRKEGGKSGDWVEGVSVGA